MCMVNRVRPLVQTNYENSPQMWMYRAYNGYLYNGGHTNSKVCRKIAKGDTIRVEIDMDEGVLI